MFWLPQEDTSVIVLASAPSTLSAAERLPTIAAASSFKDDDKTHVLYDLGNGQHLQLLRQGADSDAAPVVALVPLGIDGFDRLESIHRLLAGLHGRVIPPDTRLTHQQRSRARRMLQAFDGSRAGATQQEIAKVIFRIGGLSRDEWQASSTRHAVMSLLRDARAMIAGGYRKLLRHRRRT